MADSTLTLPEGLTCQRILRRIVNLKKKWRNKSDFFEIYGKLRSLLYLTPEYKSFLAEVRARTNGMCGEKGCSKRGRHVHHIKRLYQCPELAVSVDNGVYLCVSCHKKKHSHPLRQAS